VTNLLDEKTRVREDCIFKFWLQKLSNLKAKDFISISRLHLHILISLKFDPKPIATFSKTSFKPNYLEPNKPPKLP
jgi:hypothetical protein